MHIVYVGVGVVGFGRCILIDVGILRLWLDDLGALVL